MVKVYGWKKRTKARDAQDAFITGYWILLWRLGHLVRHSFSPDTPLILRCLTPLIHVAATAAAWIAPRVTTAA